MAAFVIATKQMAFEGLTGLSLMKIIPNTIEPMISQAVVDKTVIPEIFLRMSCAVAYHNSGNRARALFHMDKAIDLVLKDRLYGILTEYVRHFDGLLEERIQAKSPEAAEVVRMLYMTYSIGWARLSGSIRNKDIATNLTPREREAAKLTAFGFRASEIAAMIHLSESTVKQTVSRVLNKTGLSDKSELSYIL